MLKLKTINNLLHIPTWMAVVLIAIIVLRIPSLFEPYSYGDEMIYLTLGEAIRRGLVLYKEIHDNKPPLLYDLAAISGNLFWFRAILGMWMLVTTIAFWRLVQRLFPKNLNLVKISVIAFAILTTLPLLEGNIANAELFMIGPTIIGFLFLLKEKPSNLDLVLGGVCFSLATLFKVPAAFDFPVVFAYWILVSKLTPKEFVKRFAITTLSFLGLIVISFVWFWYRGASGEYAMAAFLQNVGYLSSWRPDDAQKSFLVKNGPLLMRGVIVLIGFTLTFIFRKKLGKGFILATIWLLFSLFAVTLSERPYPHYLIQSVPSIAILIGLLIYSRKMDQIWAIIPLVLVAFVPVYYKFYYYDSVSYYSRFVSFATGAITKKQYFDQFDGNVNRNYALAEFINSSSQPQDSVFVWGDSPPIYALSNRLPNIKYVANYHIHDFSSNEEVLSQLSSNMPDFVIILPEGGSFRQLTSFVSQNYLPVYKTFGATVWHRSVAQILSGKY